MKIVITGSRGFIGTHLRNSLQDHYIAEWDIKLKETFNGSAFPLEIKTEYRYPKSTSLK